MSKEAVQEVSPHSDLSPGALAEDRDVGRMVPVLVTTAHRGVFFGFAAEADLENKEKIRLMNCRNCIAWSSSVGGFLGLAAVGPNAECRIGKTAGAVVLHDITSVAICPTEAAAAWTR